MAEQRGAGRGASKGSPRAEGSKRKTGVLVREIVKPAKRQTIAIDMARGGSVVFEVDDYRDRLQQQIGKLLVGRKLKRGSVVSRVRMGLPLKSIERMQAITDDPETIFHIVGMSERTFHRRKQTGKSLGPVESDRLYRIAKVQAEAMEVFGDQDTAVDWLTSPSRALGEKPLALLDTEAGADQVMRELGRIDHGVYA